jgi:hypothetical protein
MRKPWTKDDLRVLRRRYPNEPTAPLARELGRSVSSTYQQALKLGLRKSAEYLASPAACRLRRDGNVGTHHRFPKGHRPWNAGKKGWKAGGRSAETRFKRGQPPHNSVPIGTVVTDADGYMKRKVRDDAPPGMSRRNWVYLHIEKWEKRRGPVPKGHAVVFKDGDKTNLRIRNLECIPRTELMRRNTVHNLPKEIALAVQLVGALNRQINARTA